MSQPKCSRCGGSGREPDNLQLGAYFRRKRNRQKLSAKTVARRIGISEQYVSDLELGKRHWSPELRKIYLEALDG